MKAARWLNRSCRFLHSSRQMPSRGMLHAERQLNFGAHSRTSFETTETTLRYHRTYNQNDVENTVNLIEEKLINKGYVVVEVPNFNSFQHLINKNNWIHLDCPRHVTHFTKEGLINFFDNKKFKIIKSSTLSFEFGFYGMLQSLLNFFVPVPNYLFFLLRKKNAKISDTAFMKNYLSLFLTLVLFLPLSIISVIFEFIAIILKKGGILRIVIQKI